jgi:hypothetical protein
MQTNIALSLKVTTPLTKIAQHTQHLASDTLLPQLQEQNIQPYSRKGLTSINEQHISVLPGLLTVGDEDLAWDNLIICTAAFLPAESIWTTYSSHHAVGVWRLHCLQGLGGDLFTKAYRLRGGVGWCTRAEDSNCLFNNRAKPLNPSTPTTAGWTMRGPMVSSSMLVPSPV